MGLRLGLGQGKRVDEGKVGCDDFGSGNSRNVMSSFDGTNEAVLREGQAGNGQSYFAGFWVCESSRSTCKPRCM